MPYETAERNDAYNIDKVHVLKFSKEHLLVICAIFCSWEFKTAS